MTDLIAKHQTAEETFNLQPIPGMTVAGKPVCKNELSAAFDLVRNRDNWKKPIDCKVQLNVNQVMLINYAIPFFAGCEPTFTPEPHQAVQFDNAGQPVLTYRVTAKGYYAAVGA